jgi:hypothetical protein
MFSPPEEFLLECFWSYVRELCGGLIVNGRLDINDVANVALVILVISTVITPLLETY